MLHQQHSVERFYGLLDALMAKSGGFKRLEDAGLSRQCPSLGLYFSLEDGELRPNGDLGNLHR